MFATNQKTRLPETITIDGIRIEIKDGVKVLGVTLDNKLGFSSFINSTCAKSYYHLRRITSIRKVLSFDLTKFLILTFVISRLDYCNSLLYGAPDYMIKKLQRVQNRVAVNRSNFSGRKERGRTFWSNCRDRMECGRILSYSLYGSVASLPLPSSNIEAWLYGTSFRFASLLHSEH